MNNIVFKISCKVRNTMAEFKEYFVAWDASFLSMTAKLSKLLILNY